MIPSRAFARIRARQAGLGPWGGLGRPLIVAAARSWRAGWGILAGTPGSGVHRHPPPVARVQSAAAPDTVLITAGRAEAEQLGMARELVRFERLTERMGSK
jgi:hypothetical protein